MECPVLVGRSSVPDEPTDFQQFRATINRLQYYDSFPGDGDSENQLHKIVKKQMAVSDYKDLRKNKRSVPDFPEGFGEEDDDECEDNRHVKRAAVTPASQIGQSAKERPRRMRSIWRKSSSGASDARAKAETPEEQPKKNNRWFGRHLRHRRSPRGGFFSQKHSGRAGSGDEDKTKRAAASKPPMPFDNMEDPEPANEWLDASKGGVIQKIPSEFKPRKKPRLKIYHLRVKRKLEDVLRNNIIDGHRGMAAAHVEGHRKVTSAVRGIRIHGTKHHHPRSFVIHINKKEGKDNQDEKIADEDDEEDEEADEEEDEDEDAEEEDDDVKEDEEEEDFEAKEGKEGVANHKDSFKDLLRSAKSAMTNRVKFAEAGLTEISQKPASGVKSGAGFSPKNKKVLIDANIKVDGALSDVLRSILRTTGMTKDDGGKSGSMSDSELLGRSRDMELQRACERLRRNEPRFRRHFLDYRRGRGH